MTRRDRTTGLPRHRERARAQSGRSIAGISITDGTARFAILGVVGVVLLLVVGLISYNWYRENYAMPNKTVLTVDGNSYSLRYFTDRLPAFAQANPTLVQGIREPSLLTKLEEEAVAVKLATERGYDLSATAVTARIAEDLGTQPGGQGSAFDTLYRQALRKSGLSDSEYRDMAQATLASDLLLDAVKADIGQAGEHVTLRAIVVKTEDDAKAARARIDAGEDMGTVAQQVSDDLTSKQQDGLLTPTPAELFPPAVSAAIAGKAEGTLVGPLQVNNGWWLIRVETIDTDTTYSDANKTQLADVRLKKMLEDAKLASSIQRDLSDGDIEWAYRNLRTPGS